MVQQILPGYIIPVFATVWKLRFDKLKQNLVKATKTALSKRGVAYKVRPTAPFCFSTGKTEVIALRKDGTETTLAIIDDNKRSDVQGLVIDIEDVESVFDQVADGPFFMGNNVNNVDGQVKPHFLCGIIMLLNGRREELHKLGVQQAGRDRTPYTKHDIYLLLSEIFEKHGKLASLYLDELVPRQSIQECIDQKYFGMQHPDNARIFKMYMDAVRYVPQFQRRLQEFLGLYNKRAVVPSEQGLQCMKPIQQKAIPMLQALMGGEHFFVKNENIKHVITTIKWKDFLEDVEDCGLLQILGLFAKKGFAKYARPATPATFAREHNDDEDKAIAELIPGMMGWISTTGLRNIANKQYIIKGEDLDVITDASCRMKLQDITSSFINKKIEEGEATVNDINFPELYTNFCNTVMTGMLYHVCCKDVDKKCIWQTLFRDDMAHVCVPQTQSEELTTVLVEAISFIGKCTDGVQSYETMPSRVLNLRNMVRKATKPISDRIEGCPMNISYKLPTPELKALFRRLVVHNAERVCELLSKISEVIHEPCLAIRALTPYDIEAEVTKLANLTPKQEASKVEELANAVQCYTKISKVMVLPGEVNNKIKGGVVFCLSFVPFPMLLTWNNLFVLLSQMAACITDVKICAESFRRAQLLLGHLQKKAKGHDFVDVASAMTTVKKFQNHEIPKQYKITGKQTAPRLPTKAEMEAADEAAVKRQKELDEAERATAKKRRREAEQAKRDEAEAAASKRKAHADAMEQRQIALLKYVSDPPKVKTQTEDDPSNKK
jgi:hypothetical protein